MSAMVNIDKLECEIGPIETEWGEMEGFFRIDCPGLLAYLVNECGFDPDTRLVSFFEGISVHVEDAIMNYVFSESRTDQIGSSAAPRFNRPI